MVGWSAQLVGSCGELDSLLPLDKRRHLLGETNKVCSIEHERPASAPPANWVWSDLDDQRRMAEAVARGIDRQISLQARPRSDAVPAAPISRQGLEEVDYPLTHVGVHGVLGSHVWSLKSRTPVVVALILKGESRVAVAGTDGAHGLANRCGAQRRGPWGASAAAPSWPAFEAGKK